MDYFFVNPPPRPACGRAPLLSRRGVFEQNLRNYCADVLLTLEEALRIWFNISVSALTFSGY